MAKTKTQFVCNSCGYETSGWMGRCPSCQAWNTLVEENVRSTIIKNAPLASHWTGDTGVTALSDVSDEDIFRYSSGYSELNRVLGGGFVPGSMVLVGGDPGIGKSTLLLQVCHELHKSGKVLYVSGEESKAQIRMRAARLGIENSDITLSSQTSFEFIQDTLEKFAPSFCVIDSIQTMYTETISSAPGSVSQAREVTAGLLRIAKRLNITIVLVGHVTKDGSIAGPRVLEHMVDTVLYFEGDFSGAYRMVRAIKNRFGASGEIAFFEMSDRGLEQVEYASSLLLSARPRQSPGSVVTSVMEGTKAVFVEIQALLTPTAYSAPQRITQGIDRTRVGMLLAILEKKFNLGLNRFDTYINVVGGLKITERACDLAIIAAVFSAIKDIPVLQNTLILGEIGLTGEVRPVSDVDRRISESSKLGFTTCILPGANQVAIDKLSKNTTSSAHANTRERAIISLPEIIYTDSVAEAFDIIFSVSPTTQPTSKQLKRGVT